MIGKFLRRALGFILAIAALIFLVALIVVGIAYSNANNQVNAIQSQATRTAKDLEKANTVVRQVAAVRDETIRQLNERTQQRDSLLLQLGFNEPGAVQALPTTQPILALTPAPSPSSPPTTASAATATPVPTTKPEVFAQGKAEEQESGTYMLSVVNSAAADQLQTRHPSVYQQTGVSGQPTKFVLDIPADYVGIVAGFKVDNTVGGVYQVLPTGKFTKVVTDGFALIVRSQWAKDEWDSRVAQAKNQGWAMAHLDSGGIR